MSTLKELVSQAGFGIRVRSALDPTVAPFYVRERVHISAEKPSYLVQVDGSPVAHVMLQEGANDFIIEGGQSK